MNFLGGMQSAVFTVCIAHKPAEWTVGLDINLWSILYAVSEVCVIRLSLPSKEFSKDLIFKISDAGSGKFWCDDLHSIVVH